MDSKEDNLEIKWEDLKYLIGRAEISVNSEISNISKIEGKRRIDEIKQKYDFDARARKDRSEEETEQVKEGDTKFKKTDIPLFQYNNEDEDYEELEFGDDIPFDKLLHSDYILLFIIPHKYRVWLWHGKNTTTRMKFIAVKVASRVRDQFAGLAFKILTIDEGHEPDEFKIDIGLIEEPDVEEIQEGPIFKDTEEDFEKLDELDREKILLRLEHAGVPEGYERKMVLVKDKLYGYKEYDRNYLGSIVKEKQLFPLKEEVEDGIYFARDFVPRMLFSYNKVVLTEFFKKGD